MNKEDIKFILKYWDKTIPAVIKNKLREVIDKQSLQKYYKNYNSDLVESLKNKKPKSDTAYIFGSGASLNEISEEQWKEISKYDTITFNWFAHQDFVDVDYYIVKDISYCDRDKNHYLKELLRFNLLLENNWHRYKNSLFILQNGPLATNANLLLYYRMLPKDANISRFELYRGVNLDLEFPWLSVKIGTLITAIHFALQMKWKKIIIAGVDLYDRDYFWYKKGDLRERDKRRGAKIDDKHATIENGLFRLLTNHVVPTIQKQGVELYVQNQKSLLTELFPPLSNGVKIESETI